MIAKFNNDFTELLETRLNESDIKFNSEISEIKSTINQNTQKTRSQTSLLMVGFPIVILLVLVNLFN
jgi:hypothetical protein